MGTTVRKNIEVDITTHVDVELDLDDFIDELTDDQVQLIVDMAVDPREHSTLAYELVALIRAGRGEEAIVKIQRELQPKWDSVEESRAAYNEAMGRT